MCVFRGGGGSEEGAGRDGGIKREPGTEGMTAQ